MTRTTKPSANGSKRKPQPADKTALRPDQLDAASGGTGCAGGVHYPDATTTVRQP